MHFINESLFDIFNKNIDSFNRKKGFTPTERFWLNLFYAAVNDLPAGECYCLAFFHNLSKTISDPDERFATCAEKTHRSIDELRLILRSVRYRIINSMKGHVPAFTPEHFDGLLEKLSSVYDPKPVIMKGKEEKYWEKYGNEHVMWDSMRPIGVISRSFPVCDTMPGYTEEKTISVPPVKIEFRKKVAKPYSRKDYKGKSKRITEDGVTRPMKKRDSNNNKKRLEDFLRDKIVKFVQQFNRPVRIQAIESEIHLHKRFKIEELRQFLGSITEVQHLSSDWYYSPAA